MPYAITNREGMTIEYSTDRGCMVVKHPILGILQNVGSYTAGETWIHTYLDKQVKKPRKARRQRATATRKQIACQCPSCNPASWDEVNGVYLCREGSEWTAYSNGIRVGGWHATQIQAVNARNQFRFNNLTKHAA